MIDSFHVIAYADGMGNPALLAAGGVVLLGVALFIALQITPFWATPT